MAKQFAGVIEGLYESLLDQGIPESIATLVRRLDDAERMVSVPRKLAIVVEADARDRDLAAALLDESGLEVVQCDSAADALEILRLRGNDTAFVFADTTLVGGRDGADLARTAAMLWPGVRIVITVEKGGAAPTVPSAVVVLTKPWLGLDLIRQARAAMTPGRLADAL